MPVVSWLYCAIVTPGAAYGSVGISGGSQYVTMIKARPTPIAATSAVRSISFTLSPPPPGRALKLLHPTLEHVRHRAERVAFRHRERAVIEHLGDERQIGGASK